MRGAASQPRAPVGADRWMVAVAPAATSAAWPGRPAAFAPATEAAVAVRLVSVLVPVLPLLPLPLLLLPLPLLRLALVVLVLSVLLAAARPGAGSKPRRIA